MLKTQVLLLTVISINNLLILPICHSHQFHLKKLDLNQVCQEYQLGNIKVTLVDPSQP